MNALDLIRQAREGEGEPISAALSLIHSKKSPSALSVISEARGDPLTPPIYADDPTKFVEDRARAIDRPDIAQQAVDLRQKQAFEQPLSLLEAGEEGELRQGPRYESARSGLPKGLAESEFGQVGVLDFVPGVETYLAYDDIGMLKARAESGEDVGFFEKLATGAAPALSIIGATGFAGKFGKKADDFLRAIKGAHPGMSDELAQKYAEAAAAVQAEKYVSKNINVENISTTDDAKAALSFLGDQHNATIDAARRGAVSWEETGELASLAGTTQKVLRKHRKGQAFNAHELLAARQLLVSSAENLVSQAKAVTGDVSTHAAFYRAYVRHAALQETVTGATAEAGRALNILRKETGGTPESIKVIMDAAGTKRQNMEELAAMVAARGGDPADLGRFVQKSFAAKTGDVMRELWYNFVLSGLQTHAVNSLSNSLVALWTIPETAGAAAIGKLHGGEKIYAGEVLARAVGTAEGLKDAMPAAIRTLIKEEPFDPSSKLELLNRRAITGKPGSMAWLLGRTVRLPGTMLMAEDDFFKAIAYRQRINEMAYAGAKKEGLTGKDFVQRMHELRSTPTVTMMEEAAHAARVQTFTDKPGHFVQAITNARDRTPGGWLVLPFIRTPSNIIKFAAKRTPFGFAMKEVREQLAAGGRTRDLALARMGIGSAVGTYFGVLAAEGTITGGGPTDPKDRAAWLHEHQPYSVRVGDQWYSYGRLEPLGMIMGIAADAAAIHGNLSKPGAEELGGMLLAAISRNLTSKTWLRGLSEFAELLNSPTDYNVQDYIEQLTGAVVPTGLAQASRVDDPIYREIEGVIENIKARAGWSEGLPAKRNLYGEPITREGGVGPDIFSPIYMKTKPNDPGVKALVELDLYPGRLSKKLKGVELTDHEYERYQILRGKALKKQLHDLVQMPGFNDMPPGVRRDLIEPILDNTREAAQETLLLMFPELVIRMMEQYGGSLTEQYVQ